jgi:hypothetical protein
MAKHSIGPVNAPANLRLNVCHQCLIEIITEGLKRLTEEERDEILKVYLPEPKMLTDEEKAEMEKRFLAESQQEEQQSETGQAQEGREYNSEPPQEGTGEETNESIETIPDDGTVTQNDDKEDAIKKTPQEIRNELLVKAKELGVEGKYATFTNKMLENEINKIIETGGK